MLPSSKLPDDMCPHKMVYGSSPDHDRLRVWGCKVWWLLPEHEIKSKISARSLPAIHLGYDNARKGYVIYIPELNRITTAHHLNFQERNFIEITPEGNVILPTVPRPPKRLRIDHENHNTPQNNYHEERDAAIPRDIRRELQIDTNNPENETEIPDRHYGPNAPRSTRNLDPRYRGQSDDNPDLLFALQNVSSNTIDLDVDQTMADIPVPNTYEEAIQSHLKDRWKAAMKTEIEDLMTHGTWETVDMDKVPKGKRITKSKWCFKVKYAKDGSIERFKCRFVACEYSQVQGIDFDKTFSAYLHQEQHYTWLDIWTNLPRKPSRGKEVV